MTDLIEKWHDAVIVLIVVIVVIGGINASFLSSFVMRHGLLLLLRLLPLLCRRS
jgi:hypothetical protein